MLFGDIEAFKNKFNTCARVRPYGNQRLGSDFYKREPSKPLFIKMNILTVHNLYKYHCVLELYKILKLETPTSLFSLLRRSRRKETLLLVQASLSTTNFLNRATKMWNIFRQDLNILDFTTSIDSFKYQLKKSLVKQQKGLDSEVWCDTDYRTL